MQFKAGEAWQTASGPVRIAAIGATHMEVDLFDPVPPEAGDNKPKILRVPFTRDGKCLVSWDGYDVDFTLLQKIEEDAPSEPSRV